MNAISRKWIGRAAALTVGLTAGGAVAAPSVFDRDAVISYSQAAIGRVLGDYELVDTDREPRQLSGYRGKPLVINLIYTGCTYACPLTVQTLGAAADVADEALGAGRFNIITVGFDSRDDVPARMRAYAASLGVDSVNWDFLSADQATADRLADELGFVIAPSPAGYEHIAQVTVVDSAGRVYQHVYGADFEPPALVEPLKALLMSGEAAPPAVAGLIERIRLFCTLYDPASRRYQFDYSIFFALFAGALSLGILLFIILRSGIRAFRRPSRSA